MAIPVKTWKRNTSGLILWKPGYSPNPLGPALTADELNRFLVLIADANSVTYAAKKLGRSREAFYDHKRNNPAFSEAWDSAIAARGDWYEQRLKAKAAGKEDGDTVAVIVGLKMTGRFVERPAITQIQVNVAENRPFQEYTVAQLRAQLDAIEAPQPAIEAEAKELPSVRSYPVEEKVEGEQKP